MMRRLGLFAAVGFGFLVFAFASGRASADGPSAEGYVGWFRHYGVPRIPSHGYYSPYWDWDRYGDLGRAYRCGAGGRGGYRLRSGCGCGGSYGTPWSVMRQYLAPDSVCGGHAHSRSWWIRRWPVRWASAPGYGDAHCTGTEACEADCPFAKAAAAEDDAKPIPTADRLVRGLERWRLGKTDAADEDFRAVLAAEPANARAEYGHLMCAAVRRDWTGAAGALRRLAELGELDAHDRLDLDDAGGVPFDPETFSASLETYCRWNFGETDAQVVCGWLLAATGNVDRARAHLHGALRFAEKDPAATKMLADLDESGRTVPGTISTDSPAAPIAAAGRPAPAGAEAPVAAR
jgi:hypothetical protein